MRYISLQGTALNPSLIGFGCASMMGRIDKKQSLDALQAALEAGITHFDTARSYGYGEAEGVLGDFLKGKRDRVYIATKLGRTPSQKTKLLNKVKPLARAVLSVLPAMKKTVQQQTQNLTVPYSFSVETARHSLETSLKELKTDYIDLLFLHGCSLEHLQDEGLVQFLNDAVQSGKIRYWGTSTGLPQTLEILAWQPPGLKVVQITSNIFNDYVDQLPALTDQAVITQAPFGSVQGLGTLREAIAQHPTLLQTWAPKLHLDRLDFSTLVSMMLQYSLNKAMDRHGFVLSSMYQNHHIAANVATVDSQPYSSEQLLTLADLLKGLGC